MKSPFQTSSPVAHDVGGTQFNFYPNSTAILIKLRGFLKPLLSSLAALSQDTSQDREIEQKDEMQGDATRRYLRQGSVNPELARNRAAAREAAVEKLVETATSAPGLRSLALLVMDSMRDDFERPITDAGADQMIQEWSLDQLMAALMGVAKASKEVFAPLGLTTGLTDKLREAIAKAQRGAQPSEPPVEPAEETSSTS